jgi:hypothetical protein
MTSIENKSTKEQLSKKTESKDQQNARLIQEVTQRAFKEFSIDEKTSVTILISQYTKLPNTMKPGEVFKKLFEIKENNPNSPRLAQIIIHELKKIITKKENDLKTLQVRRQGTHLDGRIRLKEEQK